MKLKIWLVLALAMVQTMLSAQHITVLDAQTRQPLSYVSVTSSTPRAMALTDERGKTLALPFKGADSIYFSILGHTPKILNFADLESKKYVVLLKPSDFNLDEVVVSATRWAQSRREISQRISTIRATDIALQNPQNAADLIGLSGEVYIQKSQQGGGSPMIRGFATNRLLITVDGVRMNNAIFRSGNLQNIISIDPYAIRSAEVLFGPGSVMYGSDAIGGVMLFSSLMPSLSEDSVLLFKGNAASRYSTANNEASLHFDMQVGGQKWSSVTSFSANRFGDLRMGTHGPDEYLRNEYVVRMDSLDRVITNDDPLVQNPTGYSQMNLMQKFRFRPNDQLDMEYGFHYAATTNYSRYDRLLRYRNGLPRSAEWYYGPQIWMMNNLRVTHSADGMLYDKMVLTAAIQRFEESRHDRDFNKSTLRNRFEKVDAYSLNLDFNKQINVSGRMLYGFEAVLNKVASTGTDKNISTGKVVEGPARYPQSDWNAFAAFATYQQRITEKALLQGGIRYSFFTLDALFDTAFFALPFTEASLGKGALNGSLGLVYNPADQLTLSANLSSGFRAPNVDDMGKIFDSEPGTVMVPNPGLKPEYAYNADIGLAKIFNDKLKFDLSAFYTLLTDAMVRRTFQLNGADSMLYNGEMSRVMAIQNAARADVYGVQAGLEIKVLPRLSFYSHLTWQKGEEELDDGSKSPLRHAAPMFGLSRLRYSTGRLQLEVNAHYSAEVSYDNMPEEEKDKDYMYAIDENGNPFSPAWYTLNFRTLVQATDKLSFSGGIENITDRRYRPYSSGLVAPGRNMVFAVQYRF
jgi:hemoglobin/transferrin/lactoferrin receptor protein